MSSLFDLSIELGRSESYIWKLAKQFGMQPDQSPARRISRSGLYNREEFLKRYYEGHYDRSRRTAAD